MREKPDHPNNAAMGHHRPVRGMLNVDRQSPTRSQPPNPSKRMSRMIRTGSCVVPPSINGANTVKLPTARQGPVREAGILSVRSLFMPRAGGQGETHYKASHECIMKKQWQPIAYTKQQALVFEVRKMTVSQDAQEDHYK